MIDTDLKDSPNYQAAKRNYPAQALVDLGALASNMRQLVSRVRESGTGNTAVMGVVKADAYGHGLIPAALAALAGGATWLGTAQPREALALRRAGIGPNRARILTWLYNGTAAPLADLISADIDISVGSLAGVAATSAAAAETGRPARVHIKVDTGFGRNGFTAQAFDEALAALKKQVSAGRLEIVGVWSHLSVADMPEVVDFVEVTDGQVRAFEDFVVRMERAGLPPQIRHLANSAATLLRPEIHYELTRPGIAFYGYAPDPSMGSSADFGLRPAMTLQAQLSTVKDVPAGQALSYGRVYKTPAVGSTAILPLGYADGIHRSATGSNLPGKEHLGGPVQLMTKNGPRLVRVSGRVCMDQCILDLGASARDLGVHEGDTVRLFGPGSGPTADDWAVAADTINYEIFTCLRNRIPRLYLNARSVLPAADLALLDPASLLS